MLYQQRFNPLSQFALLLVLCGGGIIFSGIIAGLIGGAVLNIDIKDLPGALLKPENIGVSRLLQVLTTFLVMAIPALIIAKITSNDPIAKLGFRTPGNIRQLIMVVCMVIAGFLLSGALGQINQMIPIPKTTAEYFQRLEDDYNRQVMAIGNMQSVADYILSLMVLALVPAIFEEMLFRGCLQQIMISLLKNAFMGILITSILFSAIHISYYGFLPRVFLGLMLGYIFYYSKNLWLSIAVHFLNNAYTLTVMYSLNRAGKLTAEAFNENFPLYYGFISAVIIYLLFLIFKKESEKVLGKEEIEGETNNLL